MKTLLLILLPLMSFGQTVITEKAKYNCSPSDKVWFTQRIDHNNDTTYIMQIELDSRNKSETGGVVLHFVDGDMIIIFPKITINPDKYVLTYQYTAQFGMSQMLIDRIINSKLIGYSINGQYEKVLTNKYSKYLLRLIK